MSEDTAGRGDADAPLLCVVIDTEEEFDWSGPHRRENRSVRAIAAAPRAQEIFARYGLVPTWVVDHPVADDADAAAVLKAFQDRGEAEIGAHLHPWVNPPHEEEVSAFNSYPGNLPPALERAKLECLTARIESAFGRRPLVYKAGRFGIGPATPELLADLGYLVDASIVPWTEFTADGGPDFRHEGPLPRAFDAAGKVMELPLSVGFAGLFGGIGPRLYPHLFGRTRLALHVPGICARLGLLERIRLTPEGSDASDHRRMTRAVVAQGLRVLTYTFHSPSLEPGHTPYVRSERDLQHFLDQMDRYFEWFFGEAGGRPATPIGIRDLWLEGRL